MWEVQGCCSQGRGEKKAQILAFLLLHLPLFHWPLPPLSYRSGMQVIMPVGIEPETIAEARLPREVLFGHAVQVVKEPNSWFTSASVKAFHFAGGQKFSPRVL